MFELLSEEVRLNILKPSTTIDSHNARAVPHKAFYFDKSTEKFNNYCRRQGHVISECKTLQNKNKSHGNTFSKGQ